MKKKIAAIIMSIVMILGLASVVTFATDASGVTSTSSDTTAVQTTTTGTDANAMQGTTDTNANAGTGATTNAGTNSGTNSSNTADLKNDATVNLVQIRDRELETLQDYQDSYGDNTYGLVAYILNIIRIYSIPFGFVGIAISGIYRYIIGIRQLDVRDKGFGAMIGIITVMVICQVLPLVFAIVVKGWRG